MHAHVFIDSCIYVSQFSRSGPRVVGCRTSAGRLDCSIGLACLRQTSLPSRSRIPPARAPVAAFGERRFREAWNGRFGDYPTYEQFSQWR